MIKPLSKRVLIPLGLTAAATAADAEIHKKNIRFRELEDIIKIVKPPEDSGSLLKGVTKTV